MKICVLGGGSSYTPELIDGLLDRWAQLGLSEICFFDISRSRMEIVCAFARRMAKHKGVAATLNAEVDLVKAVKGMTF